MNKIIEEIQNSIETKQKIIDMDEQIQQIADEISSCIRRGGKILLCGNGGSAADCQHIAGEFVNRFMLERHPLPAIALSTDTSVISSIANDYHFDEIFSKQVFALTSPFDIVIGISTSGNSKNVIKAFGAAKQRGAKAVAFTGESGGGMREASDICFCVPSNSTPRIQEAHIMVLHIICRIVEDEIFNSRRLL